VTLKNNSPQNAATIADILGTKKPPIKAARKFLNVAVMN
jgi:hypothetical protein